MQKLKVDSLEMRRLRRPMDLIYAYKIVFNLVSLCADDFFT